ncbi:MAG: DNA repair protein RecO [Planctomycetes bacterium]|nr:DNA repair protein RecO [Planctomycetota bacterium]
MLTKDTAICIRAIDYSETSQILTFFTRDTGKIGAIAKGSKRPKSSFGGPFEIFSYGKIVFAESNKDKLSTLTEFEPSFGGAGFSALSANLFTLNCCLFGAELLNKLTHDYDPHPQLFDDFLQFLKNTGQGSNNSDILTLLILFQLSLLKEVGLKPILSHCVNCRNKFKMSSAQVYFSSLSNGLICRDCEPAFPDKIRLSPNTANCLSNLKLLAGAKENTLKEIEKLLTYHLTETLGHKPKMAKYILSA